MEWNDEKVFQLISLYHSKELLWNPKHNDYKMRPKRYDALSDIAEELCTTTTEVERKFKNLSSHYYREKKKVEDSKKSGSSRDDMYHSKWFAYKSLDFLRNKNTPTPMTDTDTTGRPQPQQICEENDSPPEITAENNVTQPNKRPKKNLGNEMVSEAFNILKNASQRQNEVQIKDEDTLFGDYIVAQLRKMDVLTKAIVRHRINNIIFEAETGYLSANTSDIYSRFARPSSSHSYTGYCTASLTEQPIISPSNNSSSSIHSATPVIPTPPIQPPEPQSSTSEVKCEQDSSPNL